MQCVAFEGLHTLYTTYVDWPIENRRWNPLVKQIVALETGSTHNATSSRTRKLWDTMDFTMKSSSCICYSRSSAWVYIHLVGICFGYLRALHLPRAFPIVGPLLPFQIEFLIFGL